MIILRICYEDSWTGRCC